MRAWVSLLRYISVLRQESRSIREIGASWIRSWRPKITERRRSLWKAYRPSFSSKYFASSSAGYAGHLLARCRWPVAPGQGLLVDVGGIDPDALAERRRMPTASAKSMARVYASSPEAQPALQIRTGSPGPLAGQDPRDDLVPDGLPGRRVAEEGGDVDQDRVEEAGELLGVDLEIVGVAAIGGRAHGVHPVGDAAHQAGALVSGEVESAAAAEVLEQAARIRSDRLRDSWVDLYGCGDELDQGGCDLSHGQDGVDAPGADRGAGHAEAL